MRSRTIILLVGLAALTASSAEAADHVKVGVVKVAANGPNFIAMDRGYFATEGIEAEILPFDSAEPIAVAIVSADIDFGATELGTTFYNLANSFAPGFPISMPARRSTWPTSGASSPGSRQRAW